MPAQSKHRDKIIRAAALLFRRQGYNATGLNEIVSLSGAPKGSVYHYFPEGKEQIAEETVRYAAGLVTMTLRDLSVTHASASAMVKTYGSMLAGWLADSDYLDGCPITTTLLEMSVQSPSIAEAGCAAFDAWKAIYEIKLVEDGITNARAAALARIAVTSLQGALIVAKVEHSSRAILETIAELAQLFELACKTNSVSLSVER
jgi:TetR/AcrR family transcriptional repressor of lmrAB and yxaGH operons